MKEAFRRAARTWVQTFSGALAGVTIAIDTTGWATIQSAALAATVAALAAFAMNLDPVDTSGDDYLEGL